MNGRLKGKCVLITGSGSGIGRATAEKMLKEGAMVVVLDRSVEVLQETEKQLKSISSQVLAIYADVSKPNELMAAVERTTTEFGRLDVLVNNAAVQIMGDLDEMEPADVAQMLDVNLKGAIWGSKYAIPVMKSQGGGSIIHVSSILGLVGDPQLAVYGSTKGGLIALCKSMAVAYGPFGIRVNCICPGDVNTPMVADFFNHHSYPDQVRAEVYNHYPLRRIAEPSEVADAIIFLASEESSFISGTQIIVDGGLSAKVY